MTIMDIEQWPLYREQENTWPQEGRHILAHFDEKHIVVYQAFRRETADFAVANQRFGGNFYSFNRMTWIKPNFLWMMYRSDWGTKAGQEGVLAITITREFFDEVLERAAWSSYNAHRYADEKTWQAHVQQSPVRLQWDPDHCPQGNKQVRRAIQLGLKGEMVRRFNSEGIVRIDNVAPLVAAQRSHLSDPEYALLVTPAEQVYWPSANEAAANMGLS